MRFSRALCDTLYLNRAHFLEQGEIGQDRVNLGATQIISSRGLFRFGQIIWQSKILPNYLWESNFRAGMNLTCFIRLELA